jgi:hypothetical protein
MVKTTEVTHARGQAQIVTGFDDFLRRFGMRTWLAQINHEKAHGAPTLEIAHEGGTRHEDGTIEVHRLAVRSAVGVPASESFDYTGPPWARW